MKREDRAGLELTIIVHLVALIVLLVFSIGAQLRKETSFVLDFSGQERQEQLQKEEELKEDVSRRVDEILARTNASTPVRNIAVDGSRLKDDRNSSADAKELYKDAQRLAADLKAGYKPDIQEDARTEAVDMGRSTNKEPEKAYSGPSVLSWTLEGRKASHLPIPAYRCYGAGEVTVLISVDQKGNVVAAKVDDAASSQDGCLRNFAVRAARLSKFNQSFDAPCGRADR